MNTDAWRQPCPQYLHRPLQFLWFESDELGTILLCVVVALLFDGYLWWAVVVVVPTLYIRLKKRHPRGFLKHGLYVLGLLRFRHYPTFFENRFAE